MSEYQPNQAQRLAKARMYRWLNEHVTVNLEDMTASAMSTACKAPSLDRWFTNEGFAEWWFEKSTAHTKVAAGVEIAVERLLEIISTPADKIGPKEAVSMKDILAAADKLFLLADLYPKKRIVEKFLDKKLDAMDAEETTNATKLLELKLNKS